MCYWYLKLHSMLAACFGLVHDDCTLGWPLALGIGNFQKLKIMLLPPPYLVPII